MLVSFLPAELIILCSFLTTESRGEIETGYCELLLWIQVSSLSQGTETAWSAC